MAAEKKKNQTGSGANASRKKNTNTGQKKKTQNSASHKASQKQEETFTLEVLLWIVVALSILLFISNFGFGGKIGNAVSAFFFGIFGLLAYAFPIVFLVGVFFGVSNKGSAVATVKLIAGCLFVAFLCMFIEMAITDETVMTPAEAYIYGKEHIVSGGMVGGFLTWLLRPNFGVAGSYVIDIVILIISLVLLTERSALRWMEKGSRKVYESARNENERHREYIMQRREEREQQREEREQQREEREQQREERAMRRMDKKAAGVAMDIRILPEKKEIRSDEVSEIYAAEDAFVIPEVKEERRTAIVPQTAETGGIQTAEALPETEASGFMMEEETIGSLENVLKEEMSGFGYGSAESPLYQEKPAEAESGREETGFEDNEETGFEDNEETGFEDNDKTGSEDHEEAGFGEFEEVTPKPYRLPPSSLLTKPKPKSGDSKQQLQETAMKLQQTLKNFGVNVTITNISCGPSVTRYELQPEMGVKVHKIVNLTDDIKLNLAATDIRMEAPIPGKAAIGIEVPNKETVMVSFRELVESQEFKAHDSKIAVAVGRDIGGNVVVTDIAKMPHVLIAGATGAGKSVCINTIIMSILYKAKPDEVKLIMIDPKVVELSVYNGIPHLLIPVVTDPKKAAGALNWAVDEMTDRYNKFAECGVRDFKGYNAKIDALPEIEGETKPEKMTQIVIIVDELADLMMVASGEVEGAICRLAQLARAAGIHLIIATQRPSVNVITGLIKANMPSRIAFAVTSGIDSRTILDTVGAEKLLGKGDMLFSPQGAPKPLRVQGAFVSDNEVTDVVKFIKEENGPGSYSQDIEEKVNSAEIAGTTVALDSGSGGGDGRDAYFKDAAKLLIDKQKGSIGMLQRYFKIGFNRAARIMDQLEEAGIVGPEEGTKPRQILMTEEQFSQYVEEYL